jgi:hypothetical protein
MVQRGENFGLTLKPRKALSIGGDRRGQNLDRNCSLEVHVSRAIHLAHAAGAQRAGDFVRPDASA